MSVIAQLTLAVLLGAASGADRAATVYDNTTTYLHIGQPMLHLNRLSNGAEMGDEVRLAGTARQVVDMRLRFWYGGTNSGHFDARIRFRNLSKNKVITGPAIVENGKIVGYKNTATPAEAFYESSIFHGVPFGAGMTELDFRLPRVKVPDHFVWTIQIYGATGVAGNLGPAYFNPPSVGSSEDFFWHSDMGSPWIAYSWGAAPYANFGARIYAVSK